MFTKVLVANRGEIAVRIMRTLREMDVSSVAVFSAADVDAAHVAAADEAVLIGPAEAARSYLSIPRVIDAALRTGAQAIHPGYGFLSENAEFAAACEANGIVFIGPTARTIAAMGDKIAAKQVAVSCGIPVVPGFSEPGADDDRLVAEAARVGLPLIVKPSAGGGGKGMRVVHAIDDMRAALASARREAMSAFGDDSLLLERYVETARHVEVQVIADEHGNVVHAGDRDCSLQRRHQKVVEEAPAPDLPEAVRSSMLANAVEIARVVEYVGVGTVEFVVDATHPADHYFLEMNTRLQVEHPVTEMVTGLDLVELQVRIAAGEPLPITQDDIRVSGHAVEARVYAEDGSHGFLPSSGRLVAYAVPSGVRIDSGVRAGDVVGTDYDPLLLKVITHAADRAEALVAMDAALRDCRVLGLANNIAVLRRLVRAEEVRAARVTTGLIASMGLGHVAEEPPDHAVIAAALMLQRGLAAADQNGPWSADGWRVGEHALTTWLLACGASASYRVDVVVDGDAHLVGIDGSEPRRCALRPRPGEADLVSVEVDGVAAVLAAVVDGRRVWVGTGGSSWALELPRPGWLDEEGAGERSLDHVRSPMPGTVVLVEAEVGNTVRRGETLVVVEAMKMEYPLVAPHDGVVVAVAALVGRAVAKDEILAEVSPRPS